MKPLLAALILVILSACGSSATEPVRIGVYLPMTGNIASYGQLAWQGITTAKEMEPEVLGGRVELYLVDTKSDKVESANSVSRLIERDKVVAIIGEMISGDTIAGGAIAERHKIPMVSPTATNPEVTRGKKYVFRVCFIDPDQGRAAARLAIDQLHAKTAAMIYDVSQDYSVALAAFFKKEFAKQGGKVIEEVKFRSGDRDFDPLLTNIKYSKPDIIYAPIYYTECALIARQARQMGLDVPFISGDGAQAPELIQLGGKAVEGVYFTAHFHPDMVTTQRGKIFLSKIGADGNAFTAIAADAYFLILDAIKRSGSADPEAIRNALASTADFSGVTGSMSIGADGNAIKPIVVNKVENGKFVYVTTIQPTPAFGRVDDTNKLSKE
jgi:branched-chain amino acid transport system substrate-binding protein